MPQKRTKKQPTIEEQLGPSRMAHPAVQWALTEGLRVEPISPEKVNEELHKIIQRSDQPGIIVQRYKVRYEEARTDAERGDLLREFSDNHHNTAMESKWFQERCAEHSMLNALRPAHTSDKTPRHSKWDSYSDAKRRRMIVQTNPNLGVADLCKAFDDARIDLPPGWADKYGVTEWAKACEVPKARRATARIISTDRRQN
jgi:hypothetical protein